MNELIGKVLIMVFTVASTYCCGGNEVLGKFDTRDCILKANALNSVTQLTFWVDSGRRSVVFKPKQMSNLLNLCDIVSDTFKLKPSDVALVSATFGNVNNESYVHGEFHLQDDAHTILEIKQSTQ